MLLTHMTKDPFSTELVRKAKLSSAYLFLDKDFGDALFWRLHDQVAECAAEGDLEVMDKIAHSLHRLGPKLGNREVLLCLIGRQQWSRNTPVNPVSCR